MSVGPCLCWHASLNAIRHSTNDSTSIAFPAALQEAEQQLQQSYRERDKLDKQRQKLEHELASWSNKLGVDIQLPQSDSVDSSDASASDKVCVIAFLPHDTSANVCFVYPRRFVYRRRFA